LDTTIVPRKLGLPGGRVPLVQSGGGEINGTLPVDDVIDIDRSLALVSQLVADLEPAVRVDVRREIYAALFRGAARSQQIRRHRQICAGCQGTPGGEHTIQCLIWQRSEREAGR
jgi:hypothetical protein